jgi:hypothetical protein
VDGRAPPLIGWPGWFTSFIAFLQGGRKTLLLACYIVVVKVKNKTPLLACYLVVFTVVLAILVI